MIEELIKSNNSMSNRIKELEKELNNYKARFNCVKEFAKGMSFNNPLQYEKLKEELKRLEEDGQD